MAETSELVARKCTGLSDTCVALLIDLGLQQYDVMRHVGHSSIKTTLDLYGHKFPNRWGTSSRPERHLSPVAYGTKAGRSGTGRDQGLGRMLADLGFWSGADRNRTDDILLAKQHRLSAVLHAVFAGHKGAKRRKGRGSASGSR
jgi:hypothetical protein